MRAKCLPSWTSTPFRVATLLFLFPPQLSRISSAFTLCLHPHPRDAIRLSLVCKRLHSIVRDNSSWPRFGTGGAVFPPLSGTHHITVDPSLGWAGLKSALASCPEGGSVLAKEKEYIYGPEDVNFVEYKKPNRMACSIKITRPSASPPLSTSSAVARPPSSLPMPPSLPIGELVP